MPATLYGTFPILLPGTTESVSRNGLKKISGTILYKPGQEDEALNLAMESGDLFPDPQIRSTDAGFLELSFDAFSAPNKSKNFLHGTEILNFSKTFSSDSGQQWTVIETWIADTFTTFQVVFANPSISVVPPVNFAISKTLRSRNIIGTPQDDRREINIVWTNSIKNIVRRNYGSLDEIDVVYGLEAFLP